MPGPIFCSGLPTLKIWLPCLIIPLITTLMHSPLLWLVTRSVSGPVIMTSLMLVLMSCLWLYWAPLLLTLSLRLGTSLFDLFASFIVLISVYIHAAVCCIICYMPVMFVDLIHLSLCALHDLCLMWISSVVNLIACNVVYVVCSSRILIVSLLVLHLSVLLVCRRMKRSLFSF